MHNQDLCIQYIMSVLVLINIENKSQQLIKRLQV
jgi:hypothetical protein